MSQKEEIMTIELLTAAQAREMLNVSDDTIRRWIADGRLSAVKLGPRSTRITRTSILKLIKKGGR